MNQLWHHKRIYSFGAGTQSIAIMVAQAQGLLSKPYDYFVWADVGHDSEDPQVHAYMSDIVVPYCREHDIELIRVAKQYKGKEETLLSSILRPENKEIPIPVYMANGAPGQRSCTLNFKVKVFDKWCLNKGFSHVTIGLGFSLDESRRAMNKPQHFVPAFPKTKSKRLYKRYDFPLFDLRFTRLQSINLVENAGLPTPPRSACWFCPFRDRSTWIEDKKHRPELVEKATQLEQYINQKRNAQGKDDVYLHRSTGGRMHPLPNAIGDQLSLFEETCDSGYCGL